MANITQVGQFQRYFEQNEKHLRMADPQDVQGVIKMCKSKRSFYRDHRNGWTKDKEILFHGGIPKSVYYGKLFQPFDENQMDASEIQAMHEGFFRAFDKFRYRDKGR